MKLWLVWCFLKWKVDIHSLNVAPADSLSIDAMDPIPFESAFLAEVGLEFCFFFFSIFARYSRIAS